MALRAYPCSIRSAENGPREDTSGAANSCQRKPCYGWHATKQTRKLALSLKTRSASPPATGVAQRSNWHGRAGGPPRRNVRSKPRSGRAVQRRCSHHPPHLLHLRRWATLTLLRGVGNQPPRPSPSSNGKTGNGLHEVAPKQGAGVWTRRIEFHPFLIA